MREDRNYTANDDPPITAGDNGFVGVDMRQQPHMLPAGLVSEAVNARFRYGVAEPRKGVMPLTWFNRYGFEWPIEWGEGDINWSRQISTTLGQVYGVGVWNDPNGNDWILIAASLEGTTISLYRARYGNNIEPIPCSVGLTVPTSDFTSNNTVSKYWFTQAFDKVILSRGPDEKHLVLSSFEEGFVEAPDADDGTDSIPNSDTTLFFKNRLLVPHRPGAGYKADHVAVSDILSYTNYDPVYSSFKINQGDSDNIRRIFKFNDTTVVIFKDTSIYTVSNLVGDNWGTSAVLDQVTTEYGLVGTRSVASAGNDLWFLSQRGVVSLILTEQNKLQGVSEPQSTAIQPIIDRIDFRVAKETASAAYWRNRYYLSVPIDGGQQNNAVLVYDFINQAWSGYDTGDAIKIKYLFVADFQGSEHLYYVDYDGIVGLYEYAEQEGRPIVQGTYTCDLVVKGHVQEGTQVTVNNGTTIRATRKREVVDDADAEITDDSGLEIIEPLTVNTNDPEDGWLWGVGDEQQADHCEVAGANLFTGFTQDGWYSGNTTDTDNGCGVHFESTSPILVSIKDPFGNVDPYLQAICSDTIKIEDRPIAFMIKTRGYGFEAGNRRRFQQAQVFISTWDPEYKVTGIVDGVKEESVIVNNASYTRTKYMTFAMSDWDIQNLDDSHETPGKEDYSVILDTESADPGTVLGTAGTQLDLYQYWTHKMRVDRRGAYFQVKIEGINGRVRLHSVTSGATPGQRREGTHAGLW
jgi:hypothetical protein